MKLAMCFDTSKVCKTFVAEIFIAGDIHTAKQFLTRRVVERPCCYSIEPTEFIYTGGREVGMIIRRINYPRFPEDPDKIMSDTCMLAVDLLDELGQGSCTVVSSDETCFITRRKEDIDG